MKRLTKNDIPIITNILATSAIFAIIIYILNYTTHHVDSLIVRLFTYVNACNAMVKTCKTTDKTLNKYLNRDNYNTLILSLILVGIIIFITTIVLSIK